MSTTLTKPKKPKKHNHIPKFQIDYLRSLGLIIAQNGHSCEFILDSITTNGDIDPIKLNNLKSLQNQYIGKLCRKRADQQRGQIINIRFINPTETTYSSDHTLIVTVRWLAGSSNITYKIANTSLDLIEII